MKLDGLTHPKTKELGYSLEVPLPHAIGLLELLFAFVGQQTPQGNVGKWSNAVIAGEAGWDGSADEFIDALLSAGFLDEHEEHRLVVHDWADHCPNWVHAKLKKTGKEIIRADLSADLRGRYKPSQAKPSEDKTKTTGEPDGSPVDSTPGDSPPEKPKRFVAAKADLPESVDPDNWLRWCKFRSKSRKPITEDGARLQLKLLCRYPIPIQVQIVDNSIQNDWQGLFEPKGGNHENPDSSARPSENPRRLSPGERVRQRRAEAAERQARATN